MCSSYIWKNESRCFDEEQSFIESFTIVEGEFAIFEAGGHGYEILEENTKIIETKNGPFMGVNIDKTRVLMKIHLGCWKRNIPG